jgi:hypothetical protein
VSLREFFMLASILTVSSGCSSHISLPPSTDIKKISVTLKANERMGIQDDLEVPVFKPPFWRLYDLLDPKERSEASLADSEPVAEVILTQRNGVRTKILVRGMKDRPALVSVDGKTYYFCSSHAKDGALELVKLIMPDKDRKKQ